MAIGAHILVQTDASFEPLADELSDAITEIRVEQHLEERTSFAIRFQEDFAGGTTTTAGHAQLGRRRGLAILVPESEGSTRLVCLVRGQIEQSDFDISVGGSGSWFEVRGQDIRTNLDRAAIPRELVGTSDDIMRSLTQDLGGDEVDLDVEPGVLEFAESGDFFRYRGSQLDGLETLARMCNVSFWLTFGATQLGRLWRITPRLHLRPSPRRSKQATDPSAPLEQLALVESDIPRLVVLGGGEPETVVNFRAGTDHETITAAEYAALDSEGNSEGATLTEPNHDQTNRGGRAPGGDDEANTNRISSGRVGQPSINRKIAEAAVTEGQWFVHAETLTSVYMLGSVLQPHQLVRVVGAGCEVAGVYQVRDVVHVIQAVEHWMQVDLRTNTLPKEPGHA
jgi:hypothetical protein